MSQTVTVTVTDKPNVLTSQQTSSIVLHIHDHPTSQQTSSVVLHIHDYSTYQQTSSVVLHIHDYPTYQQTSSVVLDIHGNRHIHGEKFGTAPTSQVYGEH